MSKDIWLGFDISLLGFIVFRFLSDFLPNEFKASIILWLVFILLYQSTTRGTLSIRSDNKEEFLSWNHKRATKSQNIYIHTTYIYILYFCINYYSIWHFFTQREQFNNTSILTNKNVTQTKSMRSVKVISIPSANEWIKISESRNRINKKKFKFFPRFV